MLLGGHGHPAQPLMLLGRSCCSGAHVAGALGMLGLLGLLGLPPSTYQAAYASVRDLISARLFVNVLVGGS